MVNTLPTSSERPPHNANHSQVLTTNDTSSKNPSELEDPIQRIERVYNERVETVKKLENPNLDSLKQVMSEGVKEVLTKNLEDREQSYETSVKELKIGSPAVSEIIRHEMTTYTGSAKSLLTQYEGEELVNKYSELNKDHLKHLTNESRIKAHEFKPVNEGSNGRTHNPPKGGIGGRLINCGFNKQQQRSAKYAQLLGMSNRLEEKKLRKFVDFNDLYEKLFNWVYPIEEREALAQANAKAYFGEESSTNVQKKTPKKGASKRRSNRNKIQQQTPIVITTIVPLAPSIPLVTAEEIKAVNLHRQKSLYTIHPRVSRWSNTQGIETFGERYSKMNEQEKLQARRLHYLPFMGKVLSNSSLKKAFCFKADRGWGVLAQMFHKKSNRVLESGIIYVGVDKHFMFHLFLEPFSQLPGDKQELLAGVFSDSDTTEKVNEANVLDDSWTNTSIYEFSFTSKNQLEIIYNFEDFKVVLYPLNPHVKI